MALALPRRRFSFHRPAWLGRLFGEQGGYDVNGLRVYTGGYAPSYTLDTGRVNYSTTRALYRNTDPRYKLGAGFAKPIVNATAGFMGVPHFEHENADAELVLSEQIADWRSVMLRVNRNSLRDGDVFAKINRVEERIGGDQSFKLQLVTPDWVTPKLNPLTGGWDEVTTRYPMLVYDRGRPTSRTYTVIETLTATTRKVEVDGAVPDDLREGLVVEEANQWGVIPMVHFKNESEDNQVYGTSDLEPLEPFFKAYHDTMMAAIRGSRLFPNPKVKFKLKDVDRFLRQNFPAEEIKQGRVNFQGRDILLMADQEDAEFITANPGADAYQTLLELIFYCIVQNSSVPEFILGTAVASSKASVEEQMPPFIKNIERKRSLFEESYSEVASLFLWMFGRSENVQLQTYKVNIGWPEITPKDEQAMATTLNTLVTALSIAVDSNFMSGQAASEFLQQYVPTMLPWLDADGTDDERRRVQAWQAYVSQIEADQAALDTGTEGEPPAPPSSGQAA